MQPLSSIPLYRNKHFRRTFVGAASCGVVRNLQAGGSITITAGTASQTVDDRYYRKKSGFLSSSSHTIEDYVHQTSALGSTLGGKTVTLTAGQGIAVVGSQVVSDQGTTLAAQNNITIEAATNTTSEHSFSESKTSGVFSSGGVGFTVGKQQQSLNQEGTSTTAAASTVGSIAGNTTIAAGGQYRQTGPDIVASKGDITIVAKAVTIEGARETSSQSTEQKFKQSGLTVAVGSPVISAIQTANQMQQAAAPPTIQTTPLPCPQTSRSKAPPSTQMAQPTLIPVLRV